MNNKKFFLAILISIYAGLFVTYTTLAAPGQNISTEMSAPSIQNARGNTPTPTPTPTTNAFTDMAEYCKRLGGKLTNGKCKVNVHALRTFCDKVGGKIDYFDDGQPYCDTSVPSQYTAEAEICAAVGGKFSFDGRGPFCTVRSSTTNQITDLFRNQQEYCKRLGGKITNGKCTMSPGNLRTFCDKIGGKYAYRGDGKPYCDVSEIVKEGPLRQICDALGGTFSRDNARRPNCVVPKTTTDSTTGTIADCLNNPDDPACNPLIPGWLLDCNANPEACGSTTVVETVPDGEGDNSADNASNAGENGDSTSDAITDCSSQPDNPACNPLLPGWMIDCSTTPEACGVTTINEESDASDNTDASNDNSGSNGNGANSNNTDNDDNSEDSSPDDDIATIDPCVENPSDPSCNSATVDSSLQVDCNADPSACGSTTIDLGGGDGSSGGGGTISVDCNLYPNDPSCNTVVGP